jgi:hypothetical protein
MAIAIFARAALALAGALAPPQGAGATGNLLADGDASRADSWSHTGVPTARFQVDRKVGASAAGSLRIDGEADDGATHNWFQRVDLPAELVPGRLELSASVRHTGPGLAGVMAQVCPAQGVPIAYGQAGSVTGDCEWRTLRAVFDVPAGASYVRVLAFQKGIGVAWFDDLRLSPTDAPPTEVPQAARAADPRVAALARACASELPWVFDGQLARERARAEGLPILVYVRCTDDDAGLESARTSLEAARIPLVEDGYAKDLLFRAGPLSDRDVGDLIAKSFVPVCLTYVLKHAPQGTTLPPGWGTTGGAATFRVDLASGHAAPGSLVIEASDDSDRAPHNWTQAFEVGFETPCQLVLSASVRADGFGKQSEACVMVQCWRDEEALAFGRLNEIRKDCDWKRSERRFEVPAGTSEVRVRAYMVGAGTVWFDDLSIRTPDRRSAVELLENGGIDRTSGDGLGGFDIAPAEITTPALVALGPDGRVLRRLERQGVLSSDLVLRWLRAALADLGRDAPPAVEPPPALAAPRAALAASRFEEAASGFAKAAEALEGELAEEARYLEAWCLAQEGRHGEARARWESLLGDTRYGRKAAACLLPGGPRPMHAVSYAAWPDRHGVPATTEVGLEERSDLAPSVDRLVRMQRLDGSFGQQIGIDGAGWVDPAITAIAIDALDRWSSAVERASPANAGLVQRAREAAARARAFLVRWSQAPTPGSDAFNNAYALRTLARLGELEAAARIVARIEQSQLADGNWTVYHAARPASFNTALCVRALLAAREARVEVPKEVLRRGLDALEAMRQKSGLFPYSTATGHEWMTTPHGSIARDPLCELVLLEGGRGSRPALEAALERYWKYAHELRAPTKRLYDYFNARGHGGYYFFFAHKNALDASAAAGRRMRQRTLATARGAVREACEGDGTWMDQFLLGRAYGTAMALLVLLD